MIEGYKAQQERLDYRTGLICAVLANIHRDPKKRSKPYEPQDFMPEKEFKPKKRQTPEEMLAAVKLLNAAFGGKVV